MFLILTTAFLDILGLSFFLPMLPGIIAGFGVSASWTGYGQAIYALGMFIGGLFFGHLSDVYGRKKILTYTSLINLISYFILLYSIWNIDISSSISITSGESGSMTLSDFGSLFHGFTPAFIVYIVARLIGGLGGAGFGVIQAYISDISSPENKAKNMGLMGAAFGLAFLIGPALSGILSQVISVHNIIMICIGVVFLNVLSIFFFLGEPKKHIETTEVHLTDFHFSHTVILLLTLSFGATLAFSGIQAMSSQFYVDRFHFDATKIGYTMGIVGLIAILYQGVFIKHIRKYLPEYSMMRFGFIVLAVSFIGFGLNMSPLWLFLWVSLFPIGMGSFNPSIGSLLSHKAGKKVGKVMGYNTSVQSIGQIVGPILAGVLYTPGSGLPFLVSAGIFAFLLALTFWTE